MKAQQRAQQSEFLDLGWAVLAAQIQAAQLGHDPLCSHDLTLHRQFPTKKTESKCPPWFSCASLVDAILSHFSSNNSRLAFGLDNNTPMQLTFHQ